MRIWKEIRAADGMQTKTEKARGEMKGKQNRKRQRKDKRWTKQKSKRSQIN